MTTSSGNRSDILIVDDEHEIVEFLAAALEEEGYAVRSARNGREALAQIQEAQPALMILDLMMPELNGYEVLDALRARSAGRRMATIVLSAKCTHRDILDALERGAADFIPKPFDLEDLLLRIQVWLHRSELAPSTPACLRIYTLGPFRVFSGDTLVCDESTGDPRIKAILKYLATYPDEPVDRSRLLYLIWPDLDEIEAARQLAVHVDRIREMLGSDASQDDYLFEQGGQLRLSTAADYWCDADEFETLMHLAQEAQESGNIDAAFSMFLSALALYKDDFLRENLYDEWPSERRERLRELWIAGMFRVGAICADRCEFSDSIRLMKKVLEADPYRETAYQGLMLYLTRAGRRSEAIQLYRYAERLFAQHLAAQPAPSTRLLYEKILRGEAG